MALQEVPGFPGVYRDEQTGEFNIVTTVTQRPFYDTVEFTSGSQTAGTSKKFFDVFTNKNRQHGNLRRNSIPAHHQAVVLRIGLHVRNARGNTITDIPDVIKVYENLTFEIRIGTELVSEGFALLYPTGLGITGATTENDISVVSLSVPSPSAVPTLRTPQALTDDDEINALATFENATWLTSNTQANLGADTILTMVLDSIVEKRAGA